MKGNMALFLFIASHISVFSQITEFGTASIYDDKFNGRITASGEIFDQNKLTAAHRTLPFGTKVKVTNMNNNKSIEIRINDRGPFVNERVIDLSKKAAQQLGFSNKGLAKVKIEVLKLENNTTIIPKPNEVPPVKPIQKETVKKEEPPQPQPQPVTIVAETSEYFKVNTNQITPSGFGIQIASFTEGSNLLKRCQEINQLTTKEVMVKVSESEEKKVYRIIIGSFVSREKAEEYIKGEGSKFPGCFIVAF